MIVEVLKPLISKLGYKPREVYAKKDSKFQLMYLIFIVEASKTVYRKMPVGTVP
ncbi:MAG: hypothetical protein ACMUEL_02700 [Flavobacteriales bacterium Tduv]